MVDQTQQEPTITVDDITSPVAEFSPEVQQMVAILNRFKMDQETATLEKLKVDAAVRDLSSQLVAAVQQHRAEASADEVVDDGAAPAVEQ